MPLERPAPFPRETSAPGSVGPTPGSSPVGPQAAGRKGRAHGDPRPRAESDFHPCSDILVAGTWSQGHSWEGGREAGNQQV